MNRKWFTTPWRTLWPTPWWFTALGYLLLAGIITGCGTLDIDLAEPSPTPGPVGTAGVTRAVAPPPAEASGGPLPAVAWYGSVHSLPEAGAGDDYFKPWHLAIWPKFGPAVGLTGSDPAVNAEIDRLRDRDVKATFWGEVVCGVADYGGCQLRVDRLSADDGGPQYDPDSVEGWQGRVGRLPVQPGSQNELLYFVLDGRVIALYGIASDDPSMQAELERLAEESDRPEGGGAIRIWGEVSHKAQPVTGTVIEVDRLEALSP